MLNDFPRLLSLLRKEKKISQRKAAVDLGVSQALLSHYENGVREPGLAFVVRAATYYDVSCDYMFGRTMNRAAVGIPTEELPDISEEKGNVLKGNAYAMLQKKLLANATALVIEITGKTDDRKLISAAASYLSAAVYKVYRHIYAGNPTNPESAFSLRNDFYSEICDAEMKQCEMLLKSCAGGLSPIGHEEAPSPVPVLSYKELAEEYPALAQSLFTLLQTVSTKLEKRVE